MITTFKDSLRFSSLALMVMVASSQVIAQEKKTTEEKELELVDFKQIKKVLQEDGLSQEAKKKAQQVEIIKKEQAVIEKDRFLVPSEDEWWGIMTEYWPVS